MYVCFISISSPLHCVQEALGAKYCLENFGPLFARAVNQTSMLSEAQQEVIKNLVNAEVDLPLLNEDREGRLISQVVDTIAPCVEPSLRAFLPDCYVDCLKIALAERIPMDTRRAQISEILRKEIGAPLAVELNRSIDAALIPERLEGKLLKKVADKIVDEFVEWTLAEIDTRLDTSLNKSREMSHARDADRD